MNKTYHFSAPGRTEIGGNHTDHQHGCVLAAAVNLDAIAVVAFHRDGVIRVKSEGYDAFTVNLDDLSVQSGQKGTAAIICGIAAKFSGMGAEIMGFDMYCTSDVLSGSGISSSAAFIVFATKRRAREISVSALIPNICSEEGFPQLQLSALFTYSIAFSQGFVVALLSK